MEEKEILEIQQKLFDILDFIRNTGNENTIWTQIPAFIEDVYNNAFDFEKMKFEITNFKFMMEQNKDVYDDSPLYKQSIASSILSLFSIIIFDIGKNDIINRFERQRNNIYEKLKTMNNYRELMTPIIQISLNTNKQYQKYNAEICMTKILDLFM